MRQVTEDFEFSVTAICAKHGMGPFQDLFDIEFAHRLAYFFIVAQTEGLKVDWNTGRVYRPKD